MTLHRLDNYHQDAGLLAEIKALLAPSYQTDDPTAFKSFAQPVPGIEYVLYTLRDELGNLAAFNAFGYHRIDEVECCYLGMTATHRDWQGHGLMQYLHRICFMECCERERHVTTRIPIYATTAKSTAFAWLVQAMAEAAPDLTGYCSPESIQWLRKVAATQYPQAAWEFATPYVLRHAAPPNVRYSEPEWQRVQQAAARQPASFFNAAQIDERNGDRMLIVGYAPDELVLAPAI